MMKAETLTLDIELNILNQDQRQIERIWLTKDQFEVLEIVARVLGQTISEYLTETMLSMLESDIDETVPNKLKERFSREPVGLAKDDVYLKDTKQIFEVSYLS